MGQVFIDNLLMVIALRANDVTYYPFLGGGHSFRFIGRTFQIRE